MALSENRRVQLRREIAAGVSARREEFALSRAQLDAAIAATDDWIDANAAGYNSALPAAARNGLTAAQKAEMFSYVSLARYAG